MVEDFQAPGSFGDDLFDLQSFGGDPLAGGSLGGGPSARGSLGGDPFERESFLGGGPFAGGSFDGGDFPPYANSMQFPGGQFMNRGYQDDGHDFSPHQEIYDMDDHPSDDVDPDLLAMVEDFHSPGSFGSDLYDLGSFGDDLFGGGSFGDSAFAPSPNSRQFPSGQFMNRGHQDDGRDFSQDDDGRDFSPHQEIYDMDD